MNYRAYFKKYYGIEFSKNYEIHHMDLNHENNDIENLMILPRSLHVKYHRAMSVVEHLCCENSRTEVLFDCKIGGNLFNSKAYDFYVMDKLRDVLNECSIWKDYKDFLDGKCPNVHKIELED